MITASQDSVDILAQYAYGPAALEAALAGLTEEEFDINPDTERWTIREIVHHVVDIDDLWKTCIKMALGKSDITFNLQWYGVLPQTHWAEKWAYKTRTIGPSLALFTANRQHIVQIIQAMPDAWEQSIKSITPEQIEQRVTVGFIIELQAAHAMHHIKRIREIRQAFEAL